MTKAGQCNLERFDVESLEDDLGENVELLERRSLGIWNSLIYWYFLFVRQSCASGCARNPTLTACSPAACQSVRVFYRDYLRQQGVITVHGGEPPAGYHSAWASLTAQARSRVSSEEDKVE